MSLFESMRISGRDGHHQTLAHHVTFWISDIFLTSAWCRDISDISDISYKGKPSFLKRTSDFFLTCQKF
jgi:hypothetical protein